MIVDAHTHIFPPAVIAQRRELCERDATFRALYASPRAKLATAEDLLASMAQACIEVSVVLGFAWRGLDDCRRHNDYLLEAAAKSGGRLVPFCTAPGAASPDDVEAEIDRCASAGAIGLGELRPADQDFDLADSAVATALHRGAVEHDLCLLFHVSEPVGHTYPGKAGLPLAQLVAFAEREPRVRIIAAHWGGGLPFYKLMPEVQKALDHTWFDTAATSLLYQPAIFAGGVTMAGPGRVLFGSDFPLIDQQSALAGLEGACDESRVGGLLSENARALLRLS